MVILVRIIMFDNHVHRSDATEYWLLTADCSGPACSKRSPKSRTGQILVRPQFDCLHAMVDS